MRRYVSFYLRFGPVFCFAMAGGSFALAVLLRSNVGRFPLWLGLIVRLIFSLVPLVSFAALLVVWQRRFRHLAHDVEAIPPAYTQWRVVQRAASRTSRTGNVAHAAGGAITAAIALVLLVCDTAARFERWQTVLLSVVVVAGLSYYVWCRLMIGAKR